ncbi:MAG: ArsB/NhaD family transporter, partial [Bacilli bacterium]|nr:ArsB/NhaD family transporter [Bacilli bacterium]
ICCLARRANVNPIPYLVSEFVAANTWSMMLVIGNPTNIYLATMYQINFIDYFKTMLFPTVLAGLTSFIILALTFRKELKKPFVKHYEASTIKNKFLLANGLIHLGLCTIVLSVSSFLKIEMWFVSLIFAISLIITTGCYQLIMRDNTKILYPTLKRTPWNLVPFVISMFIIVLSLNKHGATALINKMLGTDYLVFKYGFAAFFSANLINNIPMSVLFAEVVRPLNGIPLKQAVFSAIAGSNIGAYFTPIGALAGLMWMSILKKEKIEFSFFTFIKKHFIVSVITMSMALIGILIMVR